MSEAEPRTARAQVAFFFSPGSRYSYLAATRIRGLEARTGCAVDWRPVDGRAIRARRGRDPFRGEALSGQYEWSYRERDARAWADYYGIPFREPHHAELDFALLVRAAAAARRLGRAAGYGLRITSAVYGSDRWPIDEAACIALAVDEGLAAQAFAAALADPATRREMDAAAAEAHERGAFGVPTFFVGERMFWGNDRLPLLEHYLLGRAR
jgi:2-hydroxychromene-2-carboxylate isomerase